MTTLTNKTHPILIIAAVSVILLSAAGVGAIMGWIPTSASKTSEQVAALPADKTTDKTPENLTKPDTPAATEKTSTAKTADKVPTHTHTAEKHPQKIAHNDNYNYKENTPKPAATCYNCGVVSSINAIEQPGEGTGLGAIAGGVAGALIGSQIGQGNGTTVATIAGAAGGAYAGNQVEKSVKKTKHVEINIRMDDGTYKTYKQLNDAGLMVGDKVKIVDGNIVRS